MLSAHRLADAIRPKEQSKRSEEMALELTALLWKVEGDSMWHQKSNVI